MIRRAIVLVVAFGALASGDSQLPQQVQNALTSIDTVPTQTELDQVFGGAALANLTTIAQDVSADVGIRLRAIHALAKYCGAVPCPTNDPAHQALSTLIAGTADQHVGSGLLILRSAIESIGVLQVQTDLGILLPLLDHPSRDIRTSTAHALRDLCNTQAVTPLRFRYQHEATDQVKLAISEALRILSAPPCSP